jgi:hypothetical protein
VNSTSTRLHPALAKGVLAVGALGLLASVLLLAGGLSADTAAGESWQPATELGAIGLVLSGTVLLVGLLTRTVAARPAQQ